MKDGGVEELAALGEDLIGGGACVRWGDVVEGGNFRERRFAGVRECGFGFGGGGGAEECVSTHHHHLHNLSLKHTKCGKEKLIGEDGDTIR